MFSLFFFYFGAGVREETSRAKNGGGVLAQGLESTKISNRAFLTSYDPKPALQESQSTPNPDTCESIVIHLPFLSQYSCKSMPSSWQRVQEHHQFVSRDGSHLHRYTFADVLGGKGANLFFSEPKLPARFSEVNFLPRDIYSIRTSQRSGEGIVRGNGRPKGCFWRVRVFSARLIGHI